MATILKVVLCLLFVFFSSCSKFEEEQNQTNVVPNINEAQAKIGREGAYEKYQHIENFYNIQYEDNITYEKHKKAQERLLAYGYTFPKIYNINQLRRISLEIRHLQEVKYTKNIEQSHPNLDGFLIEVFLKIRKLNGEIVFELITPKEMFDLDVPYNKRIASFFLGKDGLWYDRCYLDKEDYSRLTGVDKNIFDDLRIIHKYRDYRYMNGKHLVYQMPYKDNYLDYHNVYSESLLKDGHEIGRIKLKNLKSFVKKGSLMFIFDKPLDKLRETTLDENAYELIKEQKANDLGAWGHMVIISNQYLDEITNQYKDISQYKKLTDKQEFEDLSFFKSESTNNSISFYDFMKHFVFVEAMPNRKEDINDNRKFGFGQSGVRRTSGNDKRIQEYLKRATCIAICNLDEGYKLSHPNLIPNVLERCQTHLGKPYVYLPIKNNNDDLYGYCSGLVFDAFYNNKQYPSLLLTTEHSKSKLFIGGKLRYEWYMPRTICNSPFIQTNIWYIDNEWFLKLEEYLLALTLII